jgi:hypothetical protein
MRNVNKSFEIIDKNIYVSLKILFIDKCKSFLKTLHVIEKFIDLLIIKIRTRFVQLILFFFSIE